jgi:ATP-binding cassette, subfamily B, bacterial
MLVNAIANAALAAAVPGLIGVGFSAFTRPEGPDMNLVTLCAVLIVISQVGRGAVHLARNASSETIGQRLERDVRDELYASLLAKSMTFHSMQSVGDIMARATNDVREMNLMLNPGLNLAVGSSAFLILPLILAPIIHPQLILIPLLFIIGYIIASINYLRELRPVSELSRRRFGILNSRLAEAISGVELVKGTSQEVQELSLFNANASEYRNAAVRQSDIESRYIPLLMLGIANGLGLLHSVILYRAGLIDVGNIVGYMGYLQMFGFPMFVSLFAFPQLALGMAAARRILSLINAQNDLDENVGGHSAPINGSVVFDNVTFKYPSSDHPALENISFETKPGQIIAIVGQTGTGKSTLARLLNRTFDVDSGRITVDGLDVREWRLESLRSQISIIEQDIFLFSRTIRENIAFGVPDATQEQIEQAAKDAQAHDFIMHFADKYDTVVGERGVTLSGGQRQRIALARAFLSNPRILVLDDSTSAIDSATEDQIQRAIYKATKGRTTFLITHRLSQIRWADQIIVLRKGRIVAKGNHDDLLRESEAYRRIFDTEQYSNQHTKRRTGESKLVGQEK